MKSALPRFALIPAIVPLPGEWLRSDYPRYYLQRSANGDSENDNKKGCLKQPRNRDVVFRFHFAP
ncbi:hypothetical protein Edno5_0035 [Edwardsiella phage Edno5]|uniref:Uncharacterized protein n=1 Tax=Edwardsiella phage Edno5 TaxID=2419942 RepID=A0A3G3BYE5_9CAUD|nr:hypothetical protein KE334_gp35 [Edwardsiella phage Edno5]AYP69244.1 hypothetical protein Edno5_0035 [Edwardsiella phage Edno5]